MKISKKLILIIIAAILNFLIISCVFYLFFVRDDIVFAVKDAFAERSGEYSLELTGIDSDNIKNVLISDIKGEKNNIKYCNFLMLINEDYLLDNTFSPDLENYKDTSLLIDKNIALPLSDMFSKALEETEDKILIMSTYRDFKHQMEVFKEDKKTAAVPGSSEHQSGLALDLYVNKHAGRKFISTKGGKWIYNNCCDYGFIIRYPFFKKSITNIPFEPWHIRYVGFPHSEIIYNEKQTLEEYINGFQIDLFYKYKNYIISRQKPKDNMLSIPKNLKNVWISPDNMGFYFITGEIIS